MEARGYTTWCEASTSAHSRLNPHRCLPRLQSLPSADAARYEAFVASGRCIYSLTAPRPAGASAFAGQQGKEGVFIAERAPGRVTAAPLEALQQRAEVQSLALFQEGAAGGSNGDAGATAVLASVDCYGRAVLAHLRRLGGGDGCDAADGSGLQITAVQQLQPTDLLR